jgi:hypothetical protein
MSVVDGDILRVTCNFELGDGHQYQNVYHYIRDGTDPVSDAGHVTAITAAMNQIYDTLLSQVKSDVTEQLSSVDRIAWNEITDQWEVVENIGTFTLTFTPIGSEDALPYMSAPFVVFKTGRPRTVGKKFLFPFIETQQADTTLVAGAVTAMVAYGVQVLFPRAVSGDVTLTMGVPRTATDQWFNFLVAVVNDVIGSQKRRRPGVGA